MRTTLTTVIIILAVITISCGTTKNTNIASVSLTGNNWKLVEVNGSKVAASQTAKEPFITFSSDDKLTGNASCNNFFGTYTLAQNNRIIISQLGSTKMACPDMTIEQKMLTALPLTSNYSIENNFLILRAANNTVLAKFELSNRQ